MYETDQHLNNIYDNCNQIIDFLDEINSSERKDNIAYYTVRAAECLGNIRSIVSMLCTNVVEKSDKLIALENQLNTAHDILDDIEMEG